jgi:DNA-binding MarR family transcriptional regulator
MNPVSADARPSFTPRQGQYLAFIHAYRCLHGLAPAEADIQRYFRVSPPSVHQMVLTLEKVGLITRQPGVARSIALLVEPKALPELRSEHVQPVKTSVQRYSLSILIEISSEVLDENSSVGGIATGLIEARLGVVWAVCRGVALVGGAA